MLAIVLLSPAALAGLARGWSRALAWRRPPTSWLVALGLAVAVLIVHRRS